MAGYKYKGTEPWVPGARDPEPRTRGRAKKNQSLQPCGTVAACRRHMRYFEPIDDACKAALKAEGRRYYESKKAATK